MGRIRKPLDDAQRIARQQARNMPEARARRATRRALKLHQTPPAIQYGAPPPPRVRPPRAAR